MIVSQLVKVTKPTGCVKCPPLIIWAYEIEALINEDAATRNLSDSKFTEEVANNTKVTIDISSDEDEEPCVKYTLKVKIKCCLKILVKNPRVNHGLDVMDKLTAVLDLAHQHEHDNHQAQHGFEQVQYLACMQQLCDSQGTVESLWWQVSQLQGQIQSLDTTHNCTEFRLELMEMSHRTCHVPQTIMPAVPPRTWMKVWTKRKCEEIHLDESGHISWPTDTDSKSNKENQDVCQRLPPLSDSSTFPSPATAFVPPKLNVDEAPASSSTL